MSATQKRMQLQTPQHYTLGAAAEAVADHPSPAGQLALPGQFKGGWVDTTWPRVATASGWSGGVRQTGDRGGPGRLAGAVPRRDGPRDPAPVGALVPARPDRPGRPQEPAAARGPARARRPRPAAALHRQPGLG